MEYSIQVNNNSGATQQVAVFVTTNSGGDERSLVWQKTVVNANGTFYFKWDPTRFGLGWGNLSAPLDTGILFMAGQSATSVYPNVAEGNNKMPLTYKNNNFMSMPPYYYAAGEGVAIINTDQSFTVSNALSMGVALYVDKFPALIMQGMPNTDYIFNTLTISYYLTVTDLGQGYVMPKMNSLTNPGSLISFISISTPVKVSFAPGEVSLKYELDGTLNFKPYSSP